MKLNKAIFIGICIFLISVISFAQKKFSITGYLKNMQTVWTPSVSTTNQMQQIGLPFYKDEALSENLFHNRLNLKYYHSSSSTFALEIRNRFIYGDFVKKIPGYNLSFDQQNGNINLSKNLFTNKSFVLNSMIDRLYYQYSKNKWEITLGRQRINWGINMVWNSNDIFNTYSYFDFDYEEKPGSDALRVQYYTGIASSVEMVYSFGDSLENSKIGLRYLFNKYSYDFQFIGGYALNDIFLGFGWSGQIKKIGFRGEGTYFKSPNNLNNAFSLSASFDYSFNKGPYLNFGYLYNSLGNTNKGQSLNLFGGSELSAKYMSIGRMEIFGSISGSISPLVSGGLSGMLNPFDLSSFVGPSITYSIAQNIEVYFTSFFMLGEQGTEYTNMGPMYFLRTRWSF